MRMGCKVVNVYVVWEGEDRSSPSIYVPVGGHFSLLPYVITTRKWYPFTFRSPRKNFSVP
jgi:hypothetical protein